MLTQNEFNQTVAENLIKFRKLNGYTQLKLAETLNYSDKAISKWERGESLPDAYVLSQIAELYEISLNDLTTKQSSVKMPTRKISKLFITLLSICPVWLAATISFFVLKLTIPSNELIWACYIVAIPVTFIVLLIFSCVYKWIIPRFICISGLIWTVILSLHVILSSILPQIWLLYFVGITLQVATIIWFIWVFIFKRRKK